MFAPRINNDTSIQSSDAVKHANGLHKKTKKCLPIYIKK